MELYFEGVTEAIKDGYRPKLVPVRFYRMRQLWFDIRYMIRYVVKGRLSALIAKLCLRGPLETELWRKGLALKLPRTIPLRKVTSMLKRAGAEFQRQNGNHQRWMRMVDGQPRFSILQADDPVRKDVYESVFR